MNDSVYHTFEFDGGKYIFKGSDSLVGIFCEKCENIFDLGTIREPFSENPVIKFYNYIGMNAVAKIVEKWWMYREMYRVRQEINI